MRWKEVTAVAVMGRAMMMPAKGWFTSVKMEMAVKALEIVKTSIDPEAIPANVPSVRIGDQIGVQITFLRVSCHEQNAS